MSSPYYTQYPRLTTAVRFILISLVSVFVLQVLLDKVFGIAFTSFFAFTPYEFVQGKFWQIITYIFLHGSPFHLFFNALALYMLGTQLESLWGTKKFVQYFLITGLGGALLQTLIWVISLLFLPQHAASLGLIPIVGASGALFGLFMAYGMIFGDAYFLAFFVVPIKAKYFVMIMGGLELLSSIYYGNEGVAHLVHIGGLAAGYFYLKIKGKNLKGRGGGGGGSFFGRKKGMSKEEVRRRLSVITNENDKGDKGLPITWN